MMPEFAPFLLGFIIGMLLTLIIIVSAGNPRADQLLAERDSAIDELAGRDIEIADLNQRLSDLRDKFGASLIANTSAPVESIHKEIRK